MASTKVLEIPLLPENDMAARSVHGTKTRLTLKPGPEPALLHGAAQRKPVSSSASSGISCTF